MPTLPFSLLPHPATESPAVRSISGHVSRTPGGLMVTYIVDGALEQVRVPERRAPRFADELWRHTCLELFVAPKGETDYYEFNFSPSGEWAAYSFARYRERIASADLAALDPHITVCRSGGKLELDAVVPLARLAPDLSHGALVLAVSAVIETLDGGLSYWALKHPLAKPDFHHPDAFILELQ